MSDWRVQPEKGWRPATLAELLGPLPTYDLMTAVLSSLRPIVLDSLFQSSALFDRLTRGKGRVRG